MIFDVKKLNIAKLSFHRKKGLLKIVARKSFWEILLGEYR